MKSESPARKLRADGLRNRERLIDAAKEAFAEVGPDASVDVVSRRAAVGVGTFYRHFPTRDAIVAAVYQREVKQLADAADELLESHTPSAALHAWLNLFVDYLATKKLIAASLHAAPGGTTALYASSGDRIKGAVRRLVQKAIDAREIRADVEPVDLVQALSGFALNVKSRGWKPRTLRLIEILIDGLRASSERR